MTTEKASLEAFLRARAKNHTEDVRLQHILATYSLEKKQWERRVFNETFEQRHLAYALKREADGIKRREKKKQERIGYKKEVQHLGNQQYIAELRKKMDSGKSGIMISTGASLPPVVMTDGKEQGQGDAGKSAWAKLSSRTLAQSKTNNEHQAKEDFSQNNYRFANLVQTVMYENKPSQSSEMKKVNLTEIVNRLFPKPLRQAMSMADLERLKCLDPADREVSPIDIGDDLENEPTEKSLLSEDFWIGDPKAIGSVRRPRLPPEVMSARSKNIGDVMKLIRDLPVYPSCSKNCNKPGAKFDEMTTSQEEKTMMPSLVNANVAKYHHGRNTPTSKAIDAIQATIVSFPIIRGATQRKFYDAGCMAEAHVVQLHPRSHIIRSITVEPRTKTEHQVGVRDITTR